MQTVNDVDDDRDGTQANVRVWRRGDALEAVVEAELWARVVGVMVNHLSDKARGQPLAETDEDLFALTRVVDELNDRMQAVRDAVDQPGCAE